MAKSKNVDREFIEHTPEEIEEVRRRWRKIKAPWIRRHDVSYSIHIRRKKPIKIKEWLFAVEATRGLRLDSKNISATNPNTGEVITIAGQHGDAHVFLEGEWAPCFLWRGEGDIAFKAGPGFDEPDAEFRRIVRELADRLGAQVVADKGEVYE